MYIVIKENAYKQEVHGSLKVNLREAQTLANSLNINERREFKGPDEMRYEYYAAEVVKIEDESKAKDSSGSDA